MCSAAGCPGGWPWRGALGRLDAPRGRELRLGGGNSLGQGFAELVRQLLLVRDLGQELRVLAPEERVEEFLEGPHLIDGQVIEQSLAAREDDGPLPLDSEGGVLPLLEELDHALAARELLERRLVEVGAELGEGGQL